jgi:hypothetical protein
MRRIFCDKCGNEVSENDLHIVSIINRKEDGEEKPSIKEMEVCVFCKEKIAGFLQSQ